MMSIPPPSHGLNPIHNSGTNESQGPDVAVLTPDQKEMTKKNWDKRIQALERPLKDLVKEAKGMKIEKKVHDFEEKIGNLSQEIKKELSRKDLTPKMKKDLESKWTGKLKEMEESFVNHLPKDQKEKFDEIWQKEIKKIEEQINPVGNLDQKQMGFGQMQGEIAEVSAIAPSEASLKAQEIKGIQDRIINMVESLAVNETSASLQLKTGEANVPVALQGANLTITKTETGIAIAFNPMEGKQTDAVALLQQNKKELEDLIASLQARGIEVAGLKVGDTTIWQPPAATPTTETQGSEEGRRERGDERREGGGGQGGRDDQRDQPERRGR